MSTSGEKASKPYQKKRTAELAINLDKMIRELNLGSPHRVVCVHKAHFGQEAQDLIRSAGIEFQDVPYFSGEGRHRITRLAKADIAIVRDDLKRVVLLIEIEESKEGVRPKTLVADAVVPFFAERLALKRDKESDDQFELAGAELWVGHYPLRSRKNASWSAALENSLNELLDAWTDWKERRGESATLGSIRLFDHPADRLYDVMLDEARKLLSPVAVPGLMPGESAPARSLGEHLVADPGVCHGQLTFRGTRIPVQMILDRLDVGVSDDSILRDWPQLSPEAIREARTRGRQALSSLSPAGSGDGA